VPVYTFRCITCNFTNDVKLTMSEHEIIKNSMCCPSCEASMTQVVAPLRFKLKGEGWFGNDSAAVASAYGVTQTELNKNLEHEKRVEDYVNTMTARDENRQEL
jgi:putative FmdB family regulatory protein